MFKQLMIYKKKHYEQQKSFSQTIALLIELNISHR